MLCHVVFCPLKYDRHVTFTLVYAKIMFVKFKYTPNGLTLWTVPLLVFSFVVIVVYV